MSIHVNELINLFENRPRQSMQATPQSLFFLKEAENITVQLSTELQTKPSVEVVLKRMKEKWVKMGVEQRKVYFHAAVQLGYQHVGFVDRQQFRQKIIKKNLFSL